MNKFLSIIALVLFSTVAFAQTISKQNGPVITWNKNSHDFGKITQGEVVEHTFYFTNTGNEPLIITDVVVSCGCTTPKGWPKDPVMPGGKGELTVAFNSTGKIGMQNKPITIVSNAVNDGKITFLTEVLERKPQ
jgi:hypothetical protein